MHDEPTVSIPGWSCLSLCILADPHYMCRKYKHSKIDWDVDECCQPLERPPPAKPHKEHRSTRSSIRTAMTNRFHLLNLEDNNEEDGLSPTFSPTKTVGIAA